MENSFRKPGSALVLLACKAGGAVLLPMAVSYCSVAGWDRLDVLRQSEGFPCSSVQILSSAAIRTGIQPQDSRRVRRHWLQEEVHSTAGYCSIEPAPENGGCSLQVL